MQGSVWILSLNLVVAWHIRTQNTIIGKGILPFYRVIFAIRWDWLVSWWKKTSKLLNLQYIADKNNHWKTSEHQKLRCSWTRILNCLSAQSLILKHSPLLLKTELNKVIIQKRVIDFPFSWAEIKDFIIIIGLVRYEPKTYARKEHGMLPTFTTNATCQATLKYWLEEKLNVLHNCKGEKRFPNAISLNLSSGISKL